MRVLKLDRVAFHLLSCQRVSGHNDTYTTYWRSHRCTASTIARREQFYLLYARWLLQPFFFFPLFSSFFFFSFGCHRCASHPSLFILRSTCYICNPHSFYVPVCQLLQCIELNGRGQKIWPPWNFRFQKIYLYHIYIIVGLRHRHTANGKYFECCNDNACLCLLLASISSIQ